jgi:glycosyltransferase involved in cell wall biosynthesis
MPGGHRLYSSIGKCDLSLSKKKKGRAVQRGFHARELEGSQHRDNCMPGLSGPDGIKVIHLSSGHYPDDTRIFWKECLSLARAGYDVTFVVPGARCGKRGGVNIVPVKRRPGRFGRMLVTPIEVVFAGWRLNGLIYHFHDPELIPGGLLLRALGKRVIYDAHEDVPRDVLGRGWIPRVLRRPISRVVVVVEWIAGHTLSGIVAATPVIARRFPKRRSALVQNYAFKSEFASGDDEVPYERRQAVAYVGGVTADRCAIELVEAIAKVKRFPNVSLLIAGVVDPPSLVGELAALPGWPRVEFRGLQDRAGVRRLLAESRVGLVLFHPRQSYLESQPVKMFEYMAAGLPVIAADFPNFRAIVEGNRCGLCVPSCDVAAIAAAIEWMLEHPAEAQEMGKRGRDLVMRSLNWEHEEHELLGLYGRIVGA